MTDEKALLLAICEDPDDDTPRLAYADWCEENDHCTDSGYSPEAAHRQRAEFIRVQIELARLSPGARGSLALQQREQALLEAHGAAWAEAIPAWARKEVRFRRGFIFSVQMMARRFLQGIHTVQKHAPLQSVHLTTCDRQIDALAACPTLEALTGLDLSCDTGRGEIGAAGAETLAGSPHLVHLTSLSLKSNLIRNTGFSALASSPFLRNLTSLDLTNNQLWGQQGLRSLVYSRFLTELTALRLGGGNNDIGEEGARLLAESPNMAHLTVLDLGANHIGPQGAKALAASPHLARLVSLNLTGNTLREKGARALARSPHLTGLTELNLFSNEIGDEGAKIIASATALSNLASLNLGNNRIGPEGVRALATSHNLPNLVCLEVWGNPIGDEGARALVESPGLAQLERLFLYGDNHITDAGKDLLRERFGDRVWC